MVLIAIRLRLVLVERGEENRSQLTRASGLRHHTVRLPPEYDDVAVLRLVKLPPVGVGDLTTNQLFIWQPRQVGLGAIRRDCRAEAHTRQIDTVPPQLVLRGGAVDHTQVRTADTAVIHFGEVDDTCDLTQE